MTSLHKISTEAEILVHLITVVTQARVWPLSMSVGDERHDQTEAKRASSLRTRPRRFSSASAAHHLLHTRRPPVGPAPRSGRKFGGRSAAAWLDVDVERSNVLTLLLYTDTRLIRRISGLGHTPFALSHTKAIDTGKSVSRARSHCSVPQFVVLSQTNTE